MNNDKHSLWVEKYRPQSLNDYIFHDELQQTAIESMVENQTIPHLLFSGVQGSGKSALAHVLVNELNIDDTDVLIINASDENSVDVMRDKIKNFISTFAMGKFKIVRLEEADYISMAGQAILRKFMEEDFAESTRFILTCNYENKIIPAIKSRTQQFRFKASNKDDVTEYVANVLLNERIKFDLNLLDKYVSIGYPDIRKIINLLQQNSTSGSLQPITNESNTNDYKFELLDLLERDKWEQIRLLACDNVLQEEWEDVYRFLYENLHKAPKYQIHDKWEAGIVVIADHLYKHTLVADPEINAAALFIKLSQI